MAAKEKCDGFLQLVKEGQPLTGESSDAEFPGAIEFQSFRFGSSSGFTDSDALYAAQDKSKRGALAESRLKESGYLGIASLFGDQESDDSGIDENDAKEFEGKDLADEAACNFQIVKAVDISSPDLFRAYCSCQDLDNREVFDSATVSLRKATGGKSRRVSQVHFQRSAGRGLHAGCQHRRHGQGNDQSGVCEGPRRVSPAKQRRRIGHCGQGGLGFHRAHDVVTHSRLGGPRTTNTRFLS